MLVDIIIYNDSGIPVRKLCEKCNAYGEEQIIWDGIGNDGELLMQGLYIIYCEAVSSSGKIFRWKKVCSLLLR